MHIFLETDRLVLRRFTEADVDNLVNLDSDPDVMHFINGGRPTPREEIQNDFLPAFLDYYQRFAGYGFWAAIEKSTGVPSTVAGSHRWRRARRRRICAAKGGLGGAARRVAAATWP